jgi:hypothetical protein
MRLHTLALGFQFFFGDRVIDDKNGLDAASAQRGQNRVAQDGGILQQHAAMRIQHRFRQNHTGFGIIQVQLFGSACHCILNLALA